ncbi:DUF6160 family protein [Marinobacter sp. CHS3-4]|uniref:DUF6160 family protein n=1 Tax=Marinobacter sp. CHS3-4 TaxID=3045174 RepID=UPI0024B4AB15|nr:DUF6160 family protein [Marinobacter sp. CHS3-4]MDI9245520.1 DUF6160 family protein [Marinobacter sp. CHS3-4]
MKGLKKIALCSAVALAPFAANAEMTALDDSAMGSVTGQAGVTIDLSANVSIGEIAYQDQGFLALSGVSLTGQAGSDLDDIRLTIDVAGDGTDLGNTAMASAYLGADALPTHNDVAVDDGDLVISLRSQSGNPVDFNLGIDSVALGGSGSTIGDVAGSGGTVLVSNLSLDGLIGPVDIVIDGSSNNMNINAYFNADGNIDMPFIGTSFDLYIGNKRGGGAGPFAHAQADVGVTQNAAGEDVLGVNVTDFSADVDLENINTGGTASIGSLYMTDLVVTADMKIYGH